MKDNILYPNGFFMNGEKVTGIESISFAPAELNALETKIYDAMEVPKTVWSGSFKMKISKKKIRQFERFARVKKTRTPRKLKKQIRVFLRGKSTLKNTENVIARYMRFYLKEAYKNGIIKPLKGTVSM